MQLSLPAASFPTPAAAPACGVKTPASPGDSTDTPAESFDSLLKKDSPGDDDSKSDDGKTSGDAEQAAATLAAILWMQNPVANTPVPTLPSVLTDGTTASTATDGTTAGEANENTTGVGQATTPFFGATNSRAFGKIQSAAAQVQTNSFGSMIGDQVSTGAAAGQGGPVATKGEAQTDQATTSCITADSKTPAVVTTPAPLAGTPATAAALTEQVATTVPPVAKPAVSTVNRIPAKNVADARVSSASEKASDVTSDEAVISVSATDEKTTAVTPAADSKAATAPTADPQEKFAPLPAVLKDLEKSAAKAVEKYFLDPVQKAVTAAGTSVGIAVAKVNAAMSSASPSRAKSASLVEPSAAFVFSADTAPTATLTVDAPAPVATVRETMAAVISAVDALERRADVQQKSVDLNFNVGNEKLGVRVELKDGAVHATFRTESPEMTSALSREWHSVVPTSVGREIRVADPVFHTVAASGSDSSFTSLGQGAQQQQREQPKAAPTFVSALRREFNDSQVQDPAAPVASSAANSSQLLNVLA